MWNRNVVNYRFPHTFRAGLLSKIFSLFLSPHRGEWTASDVKDHEVVSLLAGEQGVWDPPSPSLSVMSPLPQQLSTQARKRCQAQQVCEGAACTVTIPPPPPRSLVFQMPPPFSPTVLSPSHHPVPFPSELNAICALRNTLHLFCFLMDLSSTLLCVTGCCRRGSQTLSCQRPPNKPH